MSAQSPDGKRAAATPVAADDDLFGDVEFGSASTDIGAALRAEFDAATDAIEGFAPAAAVPQRSGEEGAASTIDSVAEIELARAPASVAAHPLALAQPAIAQLKDKFADFASGEIAAWLLAGVALINLGIGIGALTSNVSEHASEPIAPDPTAPAHAAAQLVAPQQPDDGPERRATPSDAKPEGLRTLELARARLDRGEWERARTMLYSQLAVIDGISEPARSDIEARADFLIAESFRLQAAALHRAGQEPGK
jgi:hypothetical protein